jgi:hypothetical protein
MPAAERHRVRGAQGLALRVMRGGLRRWDLRASQRPDLYLANSSAVAERIARFYGREAIVVHPPVAVTDFPHDVPRQPGRFLWVHRLVNYKRPLEVAEAFRGLPELRLTMVGVGPLERELRTALPENVDLLDCSPAPAASSTWARRTSASRSWRRSPPVHRSWPRTAEGRATSSVRDATACSSPTGATRSRSRRQCRRWPAAGGTGMTCA